MTVSSPRKKGEKWGYVDSGGSVVVDFQYEDACPFINGRGAVCLHGMWTTVDRERCDCLEIL